ncbi:hypothetical protein MNBD_GAMMA11-2851 [hydrothermal vent metagenome]|uniref:Uncharacterized protein n=1 Tax=hydrothermal vent metagenome TaxID=652676 RepID=A0A3B0XUK3_9ZZZZ
MHTFYALALLFFSLIISTYSVAGPEVKLCIKPACKSPVRIRISDPAWSSIKELYNTPFPQDKDEQDNMASAISLMEPDLYSTLAKRFSHNIQNNENIKTALIKERAEDLFRANTAVNNYRNIKTYLGVLMDNYLVTRHFMRKTLNQKNWTGFTSSGIMLQSLQNSQLYILQINHSDLGTPPVISPYTSGEDIFNNPGTELSDEDDDFE